MVGRSAPAVASSPAPDSAGMASTASAKSARCTSTRGVVPDVHQSTEAAFMIDAAGNTDRLVCRAEMRVAADLHRDGVTQITEPDDVLALGGL